MGGEDLAVHHYEVVVLLCFLPRDGGGQTPAFHTDHITEPDDGIQMLGSTRGRERERERYFALRKRKCYLQKEKCRTIQFLYIRESRSVLSTVNFIMDRTSKLGDAGTGNTHLPTPGGKVFVFLLENKRHVSTSKLFKG